MYRTHSLRLLYLYMYVCIYIEYRDLYVCMCVYRIYTQTHTHTLVRVYTNVPRGEEPRVNVRGGGGEDSSEAAGKVQLLLRLP
jgi:hypothetical protein